MPRHKPSPLALWTALSLPLLALMGGLFALYGGEAAIAEHFALWRADNVQVAAWLTLYTDWGNVALYLVWAGLLALALARGDKRLLALVLAYLAAQLLVSLAAVRMLKMSIGRPRPMTGDLPFSPFTSLGAYHSMPSGHSAEMTLQALPLALRTRNLLLPYLPSVLLGLALAVMGFTRVALGWHHPSDVLAGWALGTLGGLLTELLAHRIAQLLTEAPKLRWKP
jgi:membrane-associated phospholipid phosphatase